MAAVPPALERALARAAALLSAADAVYVTCGAGMSVDSGLPDFRGRGGFWRAYPQLQRAGLAFHDAASPALFRDDPELAWGFYGHRLALYRGTAPHAGYGALARYMRDAKGGRGFVFTSNVDGQWAAAGWPTDRILECHGSLHHLQCENPRCCYHARMRRVHPICSAAAPGGGGCGEMAGSSPDAVDAVPVDVIVDAATLRAEPRTIPRCPRGCGNIGRPNVLMFGDPFFLPDRLEEQTARHDAWLDAVHTEAPPDRSDGGDRVPRREGGGSSATAAADPPHEARLHEPERRLRRQRRRRQRLVVLDIGSGTAIPTCRLQGESTARYHATLGNRSDGGSPPPATASDSDEPLPAAALIRLNPREAFIASPCPRACEWVELPLGAAEGLAELLSRAGDGR
jgi:NAD-dependent SIR2 family protein deacetylase